MQAECYYTMSEQINHDHFGVEGFNLDTREARLLSEHQTKEAEQQALSGSKQIDSGWCAGFIRSFIRFG